MKTYLFAIFFFQLIFVSHAWSQSNPIVNPGFEDWSSDLPDWWISDLNGSIYQSSDAHSGFSALGGKVVAGGSDSVYSPDIFTVYASGGYYVQGFPIDFRPAKVEGYYKFTKADDDEFDLLAWLWNGQADVGSVLYNDDTTRLDYYHFVLPFKYVSGDVPNLANLAFSIGSPSTLYNLGHVGSSFVIDDVSFTGFASDGVASGQTTTSLDASYPNPASSAATFQYALGQAGHVHIEILSLLGEKVASVVDEYETAGEHQHNIKLPQLPSGTYCYRLMTSSGEVFHRFLQIEH